MKEGNMDTKFKNLGVSSPIIRAIENMNFHTPSLVQSKVIPLVLEKKDLIVISKTGSGKTGAFGIPIVQSIDAEIKGPQALILTPTRELAVQVDGELKKMSKYLNIRTAAVYGQHNIKTEIGEIRKGASIITGTPGRVLDHITNNRLGTRHLRFLILDEADRMLDMGFIDQVVKIMKVLPKNRVTLLFSATIPDEIKRICKAYMKNPITIELESDTKTVDTIKQVYYRVKHNEKRTQLNRILKVERPDSCMVFCNKRVDVDKVNTYLLRKGYITASLHGGNSQSSRMRTIGKFKKGTIQILVATDVAARGIHIDDLNLVVNYDVPMDKDSYVHRIGRTGRVGNSGKAISLVTSDDIMTLYEIEEHIGVLIEEQDLPTDAFIRECLAKGNGKWEKQKRYKPISKAGRPNNQVSSCNNEKVTEHKNELKDNTKEVKITPVKKKSFFRFISDFIKGKK